MKGKVLGLAICLAVLLGITACGPQLTGGEEATPTASPTTTANTTGGPDYSGLGLTEEQIEKLQKTGIANVSSAEVASKIAGFTVATPAYVPPGFTAGTYGVVLSGGGMQGGFVPKFNNTKVTQGFIWSENKRVIIMVTQGPAKFSLAGGEPAEVAGVPGERAFIKGDSAFPYDKLAFGWGKDGMWFSLLGVLSRPLNEAELLKVAGSIQ